MVIDNMVDRIIGYELEVKFNNKDSSYNQVIGFGEIVVVNFD